MNLLNEALVFAMNAHDGQVRKSDPDKPMIVHPIDVAKILKEYGFDDEVVAAGYLHDVIEDTKYKDIDIEKIFGKNILSLVECASEPDKSLSWEERKQHTIDFTKDLDLRHKAVICADKISNMEDIMILNEIYGNGFSNLKRGFEENKWYFEELYKSLINNQDENHPMFVRLKKLIDHVFYNVKDDDYVKNTIFKNNENEYNSLKQLHYKKEDIKKLKSIESLNKPYTIEFTGTPRTGKTTLINNLYDFFIKGGFKVESLEEFTTSNKYKKDIYPSIKGKSLYEINTEIPKHVLEKLYESYNNNPDLVIVDRSLLDRLIWMNRLFINDKITKDQYEDYKGIYIPIIKDNINIVIGTFADSLTALRRDYNAHLSLEKRRFLNEDNVKEYNEALLNVEELCDDEGINFYLFDTTRTSQREISFGVSNVILDDMRTNYIDRVKKLVLTNKKNNN